MSKAEVPGLKAQSPPASAELLCSSSARPRILPRCFMPLPWLSDSSGLMAYPLVMTTVLYWDLLHALGRKSHPCPFSVQLLLLEKSTQPHA